MRAPLAVWWLGCLLLVWAGCDRGKSSSGAGATNAAGAAEKPGSSVLNAPADYLGAMDKAKQMAIKTTDLATINQAIQMFKVEEGRNPKDLNELVQERYLPRIPDAPRGTKIVYDPATATVKVVPQ